MTDARRGAVVLVPYLTHIEAACERGLRGLEQRGYEVRRFPATAAIDRTRSEMATTALADGFDELLWIDSDIAFDAADVDKLRAHHLPLVGGLYAKKGPQSFAAYLEPGTDVLKLGAVGGLAPVRYLGLGFLLTHRRVYDDVQARYSLPYANARFGAAVVPYFLPLVIQDPEQADAYWYLGEDYAFCERARKVGYQVMVDTTIRLGHVGAYVYGWEDAVQARPRVASVTVNLKPQQPNAPIAPDAAEVAPEPAVVPDPAAITPDAAEVTPATDAATADAR